MKQDVSQSENGNDNSKVEIAKQVVSQLEEYKYIFRIPWEHITKIINKCNGDSKKALFYN